MRLTHQIMSYLKNVPLPRLLGLTFAIILLSSVILCGFIARHFITRWVDSVVAQAAVNSMETIRREVEGVLDDIDQYVSETAREVSAGRIRIDSTESMSRYLWDSSQSVQAKWMSSIQYATQQGQMMAIAMPTADTQGKPVLIHHIDPTDDASVLQEYSLDELGHPDQRLGSQEAVDPRSEDWYRQALQANGTAIWTDGSSDPDGNHRMITRSRAVFSDSGELLGVAAASLYLDHLQTILGSRDLDDGSRILLSSTEDDLQDRMITSVSGPLLANSLSAEEGQEMRALIVGSNTHLDPVLNNREQVAMHAHEIDGRRGYLLVRPVGHEQGVRWELAMFMPFERYLGTASREIVPLLLLVGLVSLAGMAIMQGLLKLVVDPLKNLTTDARQIAEGNFDLQLQGGHGNEVGVLTDAIRHMQRRLKTAIEYLRQSNVLLKREYLRIETTLDSLDDGVITFTDTLAVQFMNKAAARKTGWSIKHIRGSRLPSVSRPDKYDPRQLRMQDAVRSALQGFDLHSGNSINSLFPEGSRKPVTCRLIPLSDDLQRSQGALLVFNELSDLLQLQQEHERTLADRRQLAYVVEETANEIYVVEPDGFRVTMMNRTARTNLGYDPEEAEHLTLYDIVAEFRKSFPLQMFSDFKSGRLTSMLLDTVHIRRNGSRYPAETRLHFIDDSTEPYYALIAQDTTERQLHMEDVLLRDRAMASLEVGVFIIDETSGNVRYVNQALSKITGYSATELIGSAPQRFLGNEGAERLKAGIGYKGPGKPNQHVELRCKRKSGSEFCAELSISHIHGSSGAVTHGIGILDDISDRTAAEARFRQLQKFDAIGRLSGGVAHDFNNLLNVISGRLEFLATLPLDAAARVHVVEAEKAADMGARLTRRLLAFARQGDLIMTSVDLNELICDTLSILKTSLAEQVSIHMDLESDLWVVHTDRSQIENAVINLAINARDASTDGGQIRLKTENVRISIDQNTRLSLAPGDYVHLSVSDSGVGMDEETLLRVFEPFFSTKGPGKGTGLGLASIFGFVRQSGGDIVAESTSGVGTVISLYLPRYQGLVETDRSSLSDTIDSHLSQRRSAREAQDTMTDEPFDSTLEIDDLPMKQASLDNAIRDQWRDRQSPSANVSSTNDEVRLLVVEDNPEVMQVTRSRLQALGYSLRCVEQGREAMRLIEHGESFDLLFCDIVLGDEISGYDIAQAMQQHQPDCRILLTSGFSEAMLSSEKRTSHVWPVLQKPYRNSQLQQSISELLDQPLLNEA